MSRKYNTRENYKKNREARKAMTVAMSQTESAEPITCSDWVADWQRHVDEAREIYLDALAEADRVKATLKAARSHWQKVERDYKTAKSATEKLTHAAESEHQEQ